MTAYGMNLNAWEEPQSGQPEEPFDRRVAYTVIDEIQRNHDGSGSYVLTIHYRSGMVENQTVVVSTDGSAKVFNNSGLVVEEYPAGTTVVPSADLANRIGITPPSHRPSGSDTAEAWPY